MERIRRSKGVELVKDDPMVKKLSKLHKKVTKKFRKLSSKEGERFLGRKLVYVVGFYWPKFIKLNCQKESNQKPIKKCQKWQK